MIALVCTAMATPLFVPEADAVFDGAETYTQDGAIKLWSRVERYVDPDASLFHEESFNTALAWRDTETSPFIATMFGDDMPSSGTFLLHRGLNADVAGGTPILLVHGAGDNGSRAFVTLGTRLDRSLRPVFVLTFAHPHGDLFLQAEVVADAVAAVKAATGASVVDVVGHSKGGIAAAIYASNHSAAAWSDPAFAAVGTRYRRDLRRLVLLATPLDGVDTAFRWPGLNLLATESSTAVSPTSWTTWFPSTVAVYFDQVDLVDQDVHPDGLDLFPGQRQLLRAQAPGLPGASPWLGLYALQPDWYTTWHGGLGLVSDSQGIDAAVADGGDLIGQLAAAGVDRGVEIFLLAGINPILPNGSDGLAAAFASLADVVDYAELTTEIDARGTPCRPGTYELAGLQSGALVLGEITGPSDGLVFVDSALAAQTLTTRGAVVVDAHVADVSHLDLLYASPITGELLIEAGEADPAVDGWMIDVGNRYVAADTLGWIEAALADPPTLPADDVVDTADVDSESEGAPRGRRPCGGCDAGGRGLFLWFLAATVARRRGA